MSKHDTITDNLIGLTRSRSFEKAVDGWSVRKLVTLSKLQQQACELCGTRFRDGAVVVHRRSKATVVVGGTCLKTLQAQRFPRRFKFREAKQFTFTTLRTHYGPLVDPGNWLLWIRNHAPARLVQAAADVYTFGSVVNSKDLQQLIRFHDNKRLFPRNALLADPRALENALGLKIAKYITINQARKFVKKSTPSAEHVESKAAAYMKTYVRPRVRDDVDLTALWRQLEPLERRAVAALAALNARAAVDDAPLVPQQVADTWPHHGYAPMFVWNPKIGLGFVARDDVFEPPKAYVWLWRSGRYTRAIYNLDYWRGVIGCAIQAVVLLEELAFGTNSGFVNRDAAPLLRIG